MQKTLKFLVPAVLLAVTPLRSAVRSLVIPAGALVQCTVSEPNFSSRTADLNDPILCELSSSRWALPLGTHLVGHLDAYKDPGHFVGKGWMHLSFDRIIMSDRVVPLTAKVIYVPNLPVDRKGRIHGRGHSVRDAVEWSVPVLWPKDVLTLPMRGPRPALKTENRLTLKVMEDVIVPDGLANASFSPATLSGGDKYPLRATSIAGDSYPRLSISPAKFEIPTPVTETHAAAVGANEQGKPSGPTTVFILKDGSAELASNYWFEDGQRIRFESPDGLAKSIGLRDLDYNKTVQMNQDRGVNFVIRYGKVKSE